MKKWHLIPMPKALEASGHACVCATGVQIQFEGAAAEWAGALRGVVEKALAEAGIAVAGEGAESARRLRVVSAEMRSPQPEAYRLVIDADGILLEAATAAGVFRGAATLRQLARQAKAGTGTAAAKAGTGTAAEPAPVALPCVRIEDWPDFPRRGFMLDVSRCKVPVMSELFALVDLLAELKLNQLQLYTEHTFAYRNHREVWEHASPLTPAEIRELDAYCRERHVELVPNQNSFGHMERWLCHAKYAPLAEAPDGFMTPWGEWRTTSSTLCPANPDSIELIRELYAELLPNFTSRQFNVGCDETFDLGQGRSKEECELRGKGRVYLEFLLKIHELARANGRTMQFWGDIILHYPELIPELPKDIIPLVWGYEAEHPFAAECAAFAKAGFRFYVCPGTSSWQTFGGRTANVLANLRSAAEHGLANGAEGYLITDWGDFGHLQPWAVSLLPLAYGAGLAWNVHGGTGVPPVDHGRDGHATSSGTGTAATSSGTSSGTGTAAEPVPDEEEIDLHVFRDTAGRVARAAYDLGNAYRETGVLLHNASALSRILLTPPDKPLPKEGAWANLTPAGLLAAESAVTRAESALAEARPRGKDGEWLLAEFRHAAALMHYACRQGLARLASPAGTLAAADSATRRTLAAELEPLAVEHRRLWRLRNREGGLAESLERLRSSI